MKQLAPYFALLSVLTIMVQPAPVMAQSSEQKVEGYVPPPLFGAPPVAQPRPQAPVLIAPKTSDTPPPGTTYSNQPDMPPNEAAAPVYVKPRISRSNEDRPVDIEPYIPKFPPMDPVPIEQTPRGRGMIVDRPEAPMEAPLPAHKPPPPQNVPAAPIADTSKTATPVPAAPSTEPESKAEPAKPATDITFQPAQKVTSKGVVTGPKTMPAAPTTTVESETIFEPTQAPSGQPTLLEQHSQRQNPAPAAPAEAPPPQTPPDSFTPIATLTPLEAGKSRLSLGFAPGITALSEPQNLTLIDQILPALRANPTSRVQIQAFATPADTSQSSDRRIALSRALAIRDALLEDGVESRRIDVRAIGQNPNGMTMDQVDLILSGINQKP